MDAPAIETVEAFVRAINAHDRVAMSDLMTEDHTFVDSGGTAMTGRDAMLAGWQDYFRMFPDYVIHVDTLLADGAVVAAFGSASGTYNGKRGLVAANRIAMPDAWKAVVEGGRVKRWQVYTDWTEGCKTIEEDKQVG